MTTYKSNPTEKTVINFKLEYFNTTSSKMIMRFLKLPRNDKVRNVDLNHFEKDDRDLKYEGNLLSSNLDIELNYVELDEFDFDHF